MEKKIKELETKLSTYERSYQNQFDQMTNLEQKVNSVKTYFQRLTSSQTRLDKNGKMGYLNQPDVLWKL